MIHDPLESAGAPSLKSSEWQTSDPARKRLLSLLAKPEDANHIGLRPTEGWRQRNWQFLGEVLIPSLLTPREPGREIVNIPLASNSRHRTCGRVFAVSSTARGRSWSMERKYCGAEYRTAHYVVGKFLAFFATSRLRGLTSGLSVTGSATRTSTDLNQS